MCVGGNCKNYSKKSKVAEMPLMIVVPGPIIQCVTCVSACVGGAVLVACVLLVHISGYGRNWILISADG